MFINTTALRAGSRGVARVDCFDSNTRNLSFVFDKHAELCKCPRVMLFPLSFSNRCSGTDAPQVFDGDTPTSVFSLSNNTLGYAMIGVCGEIMFFTRSFFEKFLSRLSSLRLEFLSKLRVAFSETINLCTRINSSIGISRYINYSKINPKKFCSHNFRLFRNINDNNQVEDTEIARPEGRRRRVK